MRSRDLLLPFGVLILLASAAIALLGDPSSAGELPPPAPADAPPHGDAPGPDDPPAAAVGGAVQPSAVAVVEPVFSHRAGPDTSGWTSGMIAGDIPLTPSILGDIQSISVVVDELKNLRGGGTPPFRKVVRVEMGVGTPTFVVKDVPFSKYGYVVRVHSPGLNGGQATVTIDEDHPYVDDVKLPITPGSPFSLRLRDQDARPLEYTEVRLVPVGEPLGRSRCDGQTDNFGSVVFETMLAGSYQVFVGPPGQPLMEPPVITVQPGTYLMHGSVVQPQGMALTVPRGIALTAKVVDAAGYPVVDARVRLRATDRTRLTEMVQQTDVRGEAQFPSVLVGMWEFEVQKQDYQSTQKQLTLKDGDPPSEHAFTLVRLR